MVMAKHPSSKKYKCAFTVRICAEKEMFTCKFGFIIVGNDLIWFLPPWYVIGTFLNRKENNYPNLQSLI